MARIDKHFSREVIGLDRNSSCGDAARLMAERKIGAVAVRDGDRIVGVVTERDLVAGLMAKDGSPGQPIGEVMRHDLPNVSPSASELECANLMRDHYTRHLLVADEGEVVGIVSMRDVIQLMLDEKQFVIEQLQRYVYQT